MSSRTFTRFYFRKFAKGMFLPQMSASKFNYLSRGTWSRKGVYRHSSTTYPSPMAASPSPASLIQVGLGFHLLLLSFHSHPSLYNRHHSLPLIWNNIRTIISCTPLGRWSCPIPDVYTFCPCSFLVLGGEVNK